MGHTDSSQQTKHNPDSLAFTTQGLTKVYGEGEAAAVYHCVAVDLEIRILVRWWCCSAVRGEFLLKLL